MEHGAKIRTEPSDKRKLMNRQLKLYRMKILTKSMLLLLVVAVFLLTFTSCGDDDSDPVFGDPELSLSGSAEAILKPGAAITVNFTIAAEGGLSSIIVNKDGGFLEEVEVTDPDATTFEYTGQTVPADAVEGGQIAYEFIAVNTQDARSTPVAFTVNVALYDLATNSTVGDVYVVTLPANGLVPDGTTVTLSEGRSYLIDSTMIFSDGSGLVIQEGVTVYMDASDVDATQTALSHDIIIGAASVSIVGTATNPVVITSSKVMTGDDPEAEDWDRFEMTDTQNSTIQYVRLEYAGDRAFRTIGLDNTNSLSYLNVFNCSDEGIYITDGNMDAKYLVATETGDSNFRIGDDYQGKMQYLIAFNSGNGEEAIYISGTTNTTISNVTVVGPGVDTGFDNAGIRINSSSGSKVYNAVVTGLPDWATRAQNTLPTDIDGPSVIAYSNVYDNAERSNNADADVWFTEASFMNSEDPIAGVAVGSIAPTSTATSSFDPTTLDAFFTAGSFKGAIESAANDWTVGWVKNPDGTIR